MPTSGVKARGGTNASIRYETSKSLRTERLCALYLIFIFLFYNPILLNANNTFKLLAPKPITSFICRMQTGLGTPERYLAGNFIQLDETTTLNCHSCVSPQ